MQKTQYGFVPVATSEAGACLTPANWQEVGVQVLAYSLEALLLKPGYSLLMQLTDFKQYLGWTGRLVLNASQLKVNKEGLIKLKSPFDGSKVSFTVLELFALISHLKPDVVLLPPKSLQFCPEFWQNWPSETMVCMPADTPALDSLEGNFGLYFSVENQTINDDLIKKISTFSQIPRYVCGEVNLALLDRLIELGVDYIETDLPMRSAMLGEVYNLTGVINVLEPAMQHQFETIDLDCECPTCFSGFSRAYLHHLLQNTPLLCQRFLMQHNAYWAKTLHIQKTIEL